MRWFDLRAMNFNILNQYSTYANNEPEIKHINCQQQNFIFEPNLMIIHN